MRTRNLIILCVVVLIAGVLFWPTLYRYDRLSFGRGGGSFPVRINRVTGRAAYFDGRVWVGEQVRQATLVLPPWALVKVTGNAGLTGVGRFSGMLYNGTSAWTLREITVMVTAKDASTDTISSLPPGTFPLDVVDVVRWSRAYRVPIEIGPLSSGRIDVEVAGDRDVIRTEWYIVTASGSLDPTAPNAALEAQARRPVTDPNILAHLNGTPAPAATRDIFDQVAATQAATPPTPPRTVDDRASPTPMSTVAH